VKCDLFTLACWPGSTRSSPLRAYTAAWNIVELGSGKEKNEG